MLSVFRKVCYDVFEDLFSIQQGKAFKHSQLLYFTSVKLIGSEFSFFFHQHKFAF